MKELTKQILLSLAMGVAVPGVILGMAVGIGAKPAELPPAETTVATAAHSAPMTIPVIDQNGLPVQMELETYLRGVVLGEMPVDFEMEALKAQSVVARTYALRRLDGGTKHPGGGVCMDPTCCQGYLSDGDFLKKGGTQSGITKVQKAVTATAGQVLTYDGALIDATYFSCSGGSTEDALAVWGSDVPYLQATDSPGEENAAHYTDTAVFAPEEVSNLLGIPVSGQPETWFDQISYTNGGGVEKLLVFGKPFTGVELRKKLQLRSTDFTVVAEEDSITFTTQGYGHRVGMSQYGAEAMAVNGSRYDEILTHYYKGTKLEQIKGDE